MAINQSDDEQRPLLSNGQNTSKKLTLPVDVDVEVVGSGTTSPEHKSQTGYGSTTDSANPPVNEAAEAVKAANIQMSKIVSFRLG